MKPKLTRWSPATCGCELIEYTDENGVTSFVSYEEAQAIHQNLYEQYPNDTKSPIDFPQKPTVVCPAHASVGESSDLYDVVLSEGKTMCGVERSLLGYDDDSVKLADVKENGERTLKEGIEYKWSFEGEGRKRTLKVEVVGGDLTVAQKEKIIRDVKGDIQIL